MTTRQRQVLIASILGSFVAFLDGSVVNVALPAIVRELGGGLTVQQWVVDAYLVTLGSLMLVAGSCADIFGRKRVLAWGLGGFLVTSLLVAAAPNAELLIAARALQGVAGAFLVPSALAFIIAEFSGKGESKAIGLWTAWTGIAFVIGPLLGGFLVDAGSWRWIFVINVLPILSALWLIGKIKGQEDVEKGSHIDMGGAILCTLGLGGTVFALIEQPHYGWSSPRISLPLISGLVLLSLFIAFERRHRHPMLPLDLFKVRNFKAGNIATVAVYGGLSIATFIIALFLQQIGGFSALQAGLSLLPVTLMMFALSSRFGALAGTFGPRIFMALGPLVAGAGFLSMLTVHVPISYWVQLFPGIVLFGLGLAMTVAPLTSAILQATNNHHAGIASAVNTAVSRIAGLVGIAAIGIVIGPQLTIDGFRRGIAATALLLITGGIIAWVGIRNKH